MEGSGSKIVDAVGQLSITGNVIPQNWYRTITYPSGKPYLTAIVILSDIVYWYRPTEVRDERTGRVVALRKKFKADFLQRSYADLAEQFGISKREAKLAVTALEQLGVVRKHLRTITVNGTKLANVLFIELLPDHLNHLTFADVTPMTSVCHTSDTEMSEVIHSDVTPIASVCQTNTETTTETTTETSQAPGPRDDVDVADRRDPIPTRDEVRRFYRDTCLHADPDRFFDENERRGWMTKDGTPIHDWRRYARAWDKYESATDTPDPARSERGRGVPSIEEVMEDYRVPREKAERMIQEGLY